MNTLQDVSSKLKDYHYSGTAFLPKIAIVPLAQEKNCSCKCLVSPGEFVKAMWAVCVILKSMCLSP